jgi:hypothetical protein
MPITTTETYYYGHGEAFMGDAVAGGLPQSFGDHVSQIDSLEVTLTTEFIEHVSKRTSIAKKDLKVARMVAGSGKMVCSKHSADLLKKYLYADKSTVTGGSFAATAFAKTTAVVGDILPLPGGKTNVTSLVITDSTGSPVTATLGTHYEISQGKSSIKVLSLAGLTQPLKAAGTETAGSQVNLLTTIPALQGLRFEGINKANSDAIIVIDLPKIQISPASAWGVLNDGNDVNKYEINFEMLEDSSNATYPFGRYKE